MKYRMYIDEVGNPDLARLIHKLSILGVARCGYHSLMQGKRG